VHTQGRPARASSKWSSSFCSILVDISYVTHISHVTPYSFHVRLRYRHKLDMLDIDTSHIDRYIDRYHIVYMNKASRERHKSN